MDQASVLIDGLTLPEAPRWHSDRLWFSDIYVHRVCSVAEDGTDFRVEAEVPGIPVGLGWLPDGRLLVVVTDQQLIVRREPDGSIVEHADLSPFAVGFANDLAVTPEGVAFVGCFGFDLYAKEPFQPGPLMRVSPTGEVTVVGEPLHFANGQTVIEGKTLIVAESFANRLSAFDILGDSELSERRDWATFGPLPSSSDLDERYGQVVVAADGISVVDAEGAIWVSDFTKPLVSRVLPGGEIVQQVFTGGMNCFATALGGADGRTLFLCVAPPELEGETGDADPAEAVRAYRTGDPQGAILAYRAAVPAADA